MSVLFPTVNDRVRCVCHVLKSGGFLCVVTRLWWFMHFTLFGITRLIRLSSPSPVLSFLPIPNSCELLPLPLSIGISYCVLNLILEADNTCSLDEGWDQNTTYFHTRWGRTEKRKVMNRLKRLRREDVSVVEEGRP